MRDPTYPLIPIANSLAAFLLIVTLVSNSIRGAHNRGVVMLEGWVLVQVLIMATQSVVWRDSWHVIAPAFCDISSHLYQGLTIGIPACSFIITRRVWFAIGGDSAVDSHKMRKELFIDYLLGIGAPLLSMVIMYPVQGSRFQVIENYGCSSYIYQCGAALILLQIWTVVFPLLSVSLYGWRIVAYIYQHRRTANRFLREIDRSERPCYIRTVALACVDIALVLPLGVVNIATSTSVGMPFWPGWSIVHQYWAPNTVADTEWRISGVWAANIYWNQCSGVILSAVIFLLFGLTSTTRDLYKKAYKRARLSGSSMAPSRGPSLLTPASVSLGAVDTRKERPVALCELNAAQVAQAMKPAVLLIGPESSPAMLLTIDIEVGISLDEQD